jgi:uncharacterized protein YndB with AHSA1/START domain
MVKTQEGYLLIADITGYTLYLSQSELEHAQEILTTLLELLVEHTRPPLVLSRLAGDAVISYGLADRFYQGQTFIEMIEDTYVAFRKAIEQMVLNNNCRCNACANISSLDLKFFIHYGVFGIQRLGNHDELVSSDVNLIHRLLKNRVSEVTGLRAYSLYTEAAIRRLGMAEICASMIPHSEKYEHLEAVQVWIQDMHPVWQQKRAAGRLTISAEQALLTVSTEVAMPPEQVWDYLADREFLKLLLGATQVEVTERAHGRVVRGSVYHCYHGEKDTQLLILEWQPFERILMNSQVPFPLPGITILVEYRLEPTERGTRLWQLVSKASGPWLGRVLTDRVLSAQGRQWQKDIEVFKARIEADLAARTGGEATPGTRLEAAEIGLAVAESLQPAAE